MENKLKPCPFCGGEDIKFSLKTTGRWERKYHLAMYCNDCHCYGTRSIITPTEDTRSQVEKNKEYEQIAIEKWNRRADDE